MWVEWNALCNISRALVLWWKWNRFNFGQEIVGAPATPKSTHADSVDSKHEIIDRSSAEVPIEVVNGPKKIFITSSGAYEIDSMQPSRNPFDAHVDTLVHKNDVSGLYAFLDRISANNVWNPNRLPNHRRPPSHTEFFGTKDEGRAPAPLPVIVFDNDFGGMEPSEFRENQMDVSPIQPSAPPSLSLNVLGIKPQSNIIAAFQPIVFRECTYCMFKEEVRNRPPFPMYNHNFDHMEVRETLQFNDRASIEGGYVINNRPTIWEWEIVR